VVTHELRGLQDEGKTIENQIKNKKQSLLNISEAISETETVMTNYFKTLTKNTNNTTTSPLNGI
jgi:hypothetical protein